jgi:hypothetical protein
VSGVDCLSLRILYELLIPLLRVGMNNCIENSFQRQVRAGDAMRVALAILCIGAVVFLLRVLAAFVEEAMRSSTGAVPVQFAKFNPSRRRGQLIEMSVKAERPGIPYRTDERIAL